MPSATTYYVYALKDPRSTPAQAFYIGKGTGNRAHQHLWSEEAESPKDRRISEIRADGCEPLVDFLVDDLSESQALRIESELIAAYGVEVAGGLLTNSVSPSGRPSSRRDVVVPMGAFERAQLGLNLLLDAVSSVVKANPGKGVTNADIVHTLDLGSDHGGASKDYLSYSLLGMLMREHRVVKRPAGGRSSYHPPP